VTADPIQPDGAAPGGDASMRGGDAEERGPVGIFPSWGALYATVVAWAVSLITLLYLFTRFLDVAP
jgi:hypothetical protein